MCENAIEMFAAVLIGTGISLEAQLFHDISLACHIAWQATGHVTQTCAQCQIMQ